MKSPSSQIFTEKFGKMQQLSSFRIVRVRGFFTQTFKKTRFEIGIPISRDFSESKKKKKIANSNKVLEVLKFALSICHN